MFQGVFLFLEPGFCRVAVVKKEQGRDAEPQMQFEDLLHVCVCVDEVDDGAFPSLGRRQVEEGENCHFQHQDPEEHWVNKLDHFILINTNLCLAKAHLMIRY